MRYLLNCAGAEPGGPGFKGPVCFGVACSGSVFARVFVRSTVAGGEGWWKKKQLDQFEKRNFTAVTAKAVKRRKL